MSAGQLRSPPVIVFCNSSFLPDVGGIENWIFQVANRLIGKNEVYVVTKRSRESLPTKEVFSDIHVVRYQVKLPKWVPDRLIPFIEAIYIVQLVRRIARESGHVVFNYFDPRPEQVYAAALLRHTVAKHIICSLGGTMSEQTNWHLKKLASRCSDLIVGISGYAVQAFGERHPNIHVCYPIGGEPADFATRSANFEAKQILTVCRVHPRKNLEFLIDVAHRFPKLSFVVAGDYTLHHEYYKRLLDQASKLKVQNVQFVGNKVGEPLEQLYRDSTLFFLPTHHEMFGLVFAEAMSYGLPVVAPCHTAIPEAVNGGGGLLYQPGDLDACCLSIQELTNSYEHWRAFSIKAKAVMKERFAQDYIGEYAKLLIALARENEWNAVV
jgi:glycosyltransferase involved in cell wall biosynthesis